MGQDTSLQVRRLVASSWAKSTQASYNTELKKWAQFCRIKGYDLTPTEDKGVEFLVWLHDDAKAKHSTIKNARSALSAVTPLEHDKSFGRKALVSRVLKGMFRERPQIPKRVVIYDTNKVLEYVSSLGPNNTLLLEELTKKLTFLLCLLSGQRSQSIAYLYPQHHMYREGKGLVTFFIPKQLKTTTDVFHQQPLEFLAYPGDPYVCVVDCLDEYLDRTCLIRENLPVSEGGKIPLILSYAYPHNPVKSATLARYVKTFLCDAGIDITVFTAHSTRAASTSKVNNMGLSMKDIAKAAGWRNSTTFQRHYKFKVTNNFGDKLLSATSSI